MFAPLSLIIALTTSFFVFFSNAYSLAYKCGDVVEERFYITKTICNDVGLLFKKERYFKSTDTISLIDYYQEDRLKLRQSFNTEKEMIQEFGYEYPDSRSFYRVSFGFLKDSKVETGRRRFEGSPFSKDKKLIEDWIYEKQKNESFELKVIDYFQDDLIVKRDIFNDNTQKKETYFYKHPLKKSSFKHIDSFTAFNKNGVLIKNYNPNQSINVKRYVTDVVKYAVLTNSNRRRMAVIDTGFDVSHSELAYKFHLNINEKIDGIDNDENGVVDDLIGWNISDEGEFSNNINEQVSLKSKVKPYKPFSHGTHVASLALKDVEDFSLTAYSGNMADVKHLNKIETAIREENIEFVNMSFSIGNPNAPLSPGKESFRALDSLIKNNQETLFVVAAGNRGQDLDGGALGSREFPASYKHSNILTVAALEADKIEEFRMPFYEPIFFSARGRKTVDIFAPGQLISGAAVGGGHIEVSGTSMATPVVLNLILKIAADFPGLSSNSLRELILYSAYIPDLNFPFECTSGGMVFPRTAFEVAKRVVDEELEVKEAALLVRADERFLLTGELSDHTQLEQLKALWKERGL